MVNEFAIPNGTMVSEVELIYRPKIKASARPKITKSKDAYELLWKTWNLNAVELFEQFKVLMLNNASRVLGLYEVSKGGTDFAPVEIRFIFIAALKLNAKGIILAHNHPSGNLKPSQADLSLTTRIREAAKLLDIQVADHIILSSEGYLSFSDEGLF